MTRYVVINAQGEPIAENLSEAEAAHAILTYDSADYEIREDAEGGHRLWARPLNGPWRSYLIYSPEYDRHVAEAEILAEVTRTADTSQGWGAEAIDFEEMTDEVMG